VQVVPSPPILDSRQTAIGLALIIAAAAMLRFYGLAYRDLWFDELGAARLAATGNLWADDGGNPPLFFGLLRFWSWMVGTSISALRLLSAIAGVTSVAAVFWVAAELQLPASVRYWGAVLLTVSPLHLYYSQETRPYAWLILLVLVALGSFLRAIRTNDWRWWLVHAASVAAGLYTHNMMVPVAGAFWVAALVLQLQSRQWRMLVLASVAVGAAYVPWTVRVWQQAAGDSHAWIADLIRGLSGGKLVLATVEAFSPGGFLPGYVEFPDWPGTAPWAFLIYSVLGFFAAMAGTRAVTRPGMSQVPATSAGVLVIFTAAPILFLLAYTWWIKPLYVIGRYDVPALPTYLLLMAIGLHALTARLRAVSRVAALVLSCVVLIVAAAALTPKLALGNTAYPEHASVRLGDLFQTRTRPGDVVVALDITGPMASYVAARVGNGLTVHDFPAASLYQLGPSALNHRVMTQEFSFRAEAAALAAGLRGRRVWVVGNDIYEDEAASGYPRLKLLLMKELPQHTVQRVQGAAVPRQMYIALLEPR
jgi:hypothetical protein